MHPLSIARISSLIDRRSRFDRRQVKRLTPTPQTLCQVWETEQSEPAEATVQNLSAKGVGLVGSREYAPGSVLRVLLVNASHTFAVHAEIKVVRCFEASDGDYFVGGPFLRALAHDELVPFMM
jgi:hypothetical protein